MAAEELKNSFLIFLEWQIFKTDNVCSIEWIWFIKWLETYLSADKCMNSSICLIFFKSDNIFSCLQISLFIKIKFLFLLKKLKFLILELDKSSIIIILNLSKSCWIIWRPI